MWFNLNDRLELAAPAAGVQAERTDVRLERAVGGPTEGLASADEPRRGICARGVARLLFEVESLDCLRSMPFATTHSHANADYTVIHRSRVNTQRCVSYGWNVCCCTTR